MSNWTHTLTVIVPELLIAQANQLALAIGTSEDDANTFRQADWTDGTSNYAVAHTRWRSSKSWSTSPCFLLSWRLASCFQR